MAHQDKFRFHSDGSVSFRVGGVLKRMPFNKCWEHRYHSDDPRIPDEEGWSIVIWPNGRSEAMYPTALCPNYNNSFSTYETALTYLLEIYEDNK